MKFQFTITQYIEHDAYVTQISNDSSYDCIIQLRPIPPKRKYTNILLVKNETFLILDQAKLDLKDISITFEAT
jgi:hypothetical protein